MKLMKLTGYYKMEEEIKQLDLTDLSDNDIAKAILPAIQTRFNNASYNSDAFMQLCRLEAFYIAYTRLNRTDEANEVREAIKVLQSIVDEEKKAKAQIVETEHLRKNQKYFRYRLKSQIGDRVKKHDMLMSLLVIGIGLLAIPLMIIFMRG